MYRILCGAQLYSYTCVLLVCRSKTYTGSPIMKSSLNVFLCLQEAAPCPGQTYMADSGRRLLDTTMTLTLEQSCVRPDAVSGDLCSFNHLGSSVIGLSADSVLFLFLVLSTAVPEERRLGGLSGACADRGQPADVPAPTRCPPPTPDSGDILLFIAELDAHRLQIVLP